MRAGCSRLNVVIVAKMTSSLSWFLFESWASHLAPLYGFPSRGLKRQCVSGAGCHHSSETLLSWDHQSQHHEQGVHVSDHVVANAFGSLSQPRQGFQSSAALARIRAPSLAVDVVPTTVSTTAVAGWTERYWRSNFSLRQLELDAKDWAPQVAAPAQSSN